MSPTADSGSGADAERGIDLGGEAVDIGGKRLRRRAGTRRAFQIV